MGHAVIQNTGYVLAHAPALLEHHGSSACQAREINPDDEYLNQIAQFISDVSINNYDDFPKRIAALKDELDSYKVVETPRKSIGFQTKTEEKTKK